MWNDLQVEVNGEAVLLDPSGAAYLPAHRALVFADLHFEKGSSYARGGQFLPPYDSAATLARMADVVARRRPAMIIALGDTFHDGDAAHRMGPDERAMLDGMAADFIWIAGNHDPKPPAWARGVTADSIALGGLVLQHEPQILCRPGEVAGHLHPCATVAKWGRTVRRRCFVSDGRRLILPSFGAYTGGLDVQDAAIAGLFAERLHAYMLGEARVYAMNFSRVLRRVS